MRCNDYLSLLSPYIDNELTKKERIELEAHLNKCASCKEELDIQKNIRQLLLNQNNISMPSELHDKIMQSVKSADNNKKKHLFTYNRKYMQVLTTMAACFVLVASFLVFQHSSYNVKFSTAKEESGITADGVNENTIMMKKDDSAANEPLVNKNRSIDNELVIEQEQSGSGDNSLVSENRSSDNILVTKQEDSVDNHSNVLETEKAFIDNNKDITTNNLSDSDANLARDVDDEILSNSIANSAEESKESISDEYWEVFSSNKKVAYEQIQELLVESNIEYNVSEDGSIITISIEVQNKIDLFNKLKALNEIEDISRDSVLGNRITIIIK